MSNGPQVALWPQLPTLVLYINIYVLCVCAHKYAVCLCAYVSHITCIILISWFILLGNGISARSRLERTECRIDQLPASKVS